VDLTYLKELHAQGFQVDYSAGLKDVTSTEVSSSGKRMGPS
jgi:hypothetical protein